jgi:DNA-directed RNA polymerase subunit RPC12/RpoP
MSEPERYCDRCGRQLAGGGGHGSCQAARKLEPPRYCARCGRRMVVKVTPDGWSSHCTRHGLVTDTG